MNKTAVLLMSAVVLLVFTSGCRKNNICTHERNEVTVVENTVVTEHEIATTNVLEETVYQTDGYEETIDSTITSVENISPSELIRSGKLSESIDDAETEIPKAEIPQPSETTPQATNSLVADLGTILPDDEV